MLKLFTVSSSKDALLLMIKWANLHVQLLMFGFLPAWVSHSRDVSPPFLAC